MNWVLWLGPGLGVGLSVSMAARAALRFGGRPVTNEVPPDPLEQVLLDDLAI
ncbi:MAG: hypothetical protein R3F61_38250 [Myxococcota bacterium]